MKIDLTDEQGAPFRIDIIRIRASGSINQNGAQRNYVVVENNERVYCKEDFEAINKLRKAAFD